MPPSGQHGLPQWPSSNDDEWMARRMIATATLEAAGIATHFASRPATENQLKYTKRSPVGRKTPPRALLSSKPSAVNLATRRVQSAVLSKAQSEATFKPKISEAGTKLVATRWLPVPGIRVNECVSECGVGLAGKRPTRPPISSPNIGDQAARWAARATSPKGLSRLICLPLSGRRESRWF